MKFFLILILCTVSASAETTETYITLPKAEYTGSASFETLNQDSFVPAEQTRLNGDRSTVIDTLKWETAYPLTTSGSRSTGLTGVNVGGRSREDTQVSTLGVPLNYPQGGGADFSPFPNYLWNSVSISPTTSGAGFAPSASEGRVEFTPWSRAQVLNQKRNQVSRATVSYDHNSQTYSLGTKQGPYAAVLGASTGQQSGIAGEASMVILDDSKSHVLLHLLGTDQTADSAGSLTYPTPGATIRNFRVIPVIESGFHLASDMDFQSTAFADVGGLVSRDPKTPSNSSDSRTQQYGLENAFIKGADTFAFSTRYVRYTGASYGALSDWPMYAAFTHEFFVSDETSMKASLSGTRSNGVGIVPGGKVSAKFAGSEKTYPFAEVNTVAKIPTLVDRYSDFPAFNYHGNPSLKVERVYAALIGYRLENDQVVNQVIVKAEYRKGVQISSADYSTTINGGDAYLFTFSEDLSAPVLHWLDGHVGTYLTYSQLKDKKLSYPDLPFASFVAGLTAHYREQLALSANTRLIGFSAAAGGQAHPGYALFDTEVAYQLVKDIFLKGGVDNVFNSNGQAVYDYPLDGRRYFAALNAAF